MRALIADSDSGWSERIKRYLVQGNFHVETTTTGKEAQLVLSRHYHEVAVLDLSLKSHSAQEVLRYIKINHPETKVILTHRDSVNVEDLGLRKETLRKIGIRYINPKPVGEEVIYNQITERSDLSQWNDLIGRASALRAEEVKGSDAEFTKVLCANFYSDDLLIMDYYLRLPGGKYVKLFHQGTILTEADRQNLLTVKKVDYLYFKNSDRGIYVNYINSVLEERAQRQVPLDRSLRLFEESVSKFVAMTEDEGLKSDYLVEVKGMCQSLYRSVRNERSLRPVLDSLAALDPAKHNVQFLTTLFSAMISKNIEWSSGRTVEHACQASLFLYLGKLQLGEALAQKFERDLRDEEFARFRMYPAHGAQILKAVAHLAPAVAIIVEQHKEVNDGSGYPHGLKSGHIYPLSKIVGFACAFAELVVADGVGPTEAIRRFLGQSRNVALYDADVVRAFIKCFKV